MKSYLKIWLPLVVLLILGIFYAYKTINPAAPKQFSIATGRSDGIYYQYAQQYKALLKREGYELNIVESAGSQRALSLLLDEQVDIAFVQGGVAASKHNTELVSLASTFYEPLWIFYNRGIGDIDYLTDLKGLRISLGEQGSGTQMLAQKLLSENSISETNAELLFLNNREAQLALKQGRIDVFMMVMNAASPQLYSLLSDPDIGLMNFRRALAYSKQFSYLKPLTIGEGMISLEANIPDKEIDLIATSANLVTTKSLHRDLVRVILKTAKQVHYTGGVFESVNEFPNSLYVDIPMDKDAKLYLQSGDTWLERIFPFSVAANIKRLMILLIPLLTLLIPLVKGALPLYRWRIRYKIFKWYEALKAIDSKVQELEAHEISGAIDSVKSLLSEVKDQTDVPLAYMGEYYDLQVHVNLVLEKLERRSRTDAL